MSDITDKDELELHDLGFTIKHRSKVNGIFPYFAILDINNKEVAQLGARSQLRNWIANYKMGMAQADKNKKFWVTSGYGMGNKAPFVNLTMPGGEVVQMAPEDAEDLAQNLIQCAAASRTDAFVVEWSQEKLNLGLDKAAYLLNDYRAWVKAHDPAGE